MNSILMILKFGLVRIRQISKKYAEFVNRRAELLACLSTGCD
jgi:hypothetical protein